MAPSQRHLFPAQLRDSLPLSRSSSILVQKSRIAVRSALTSHDHGSSQSRSRLLVMIGPCSVHDPVATLEYASRLKLASEKYPELLILMRVYVEKPRTTVGWKGLLHSPDLSDEGESNISEGLHMSRDLMLGVLETGLPIVTEVLTPFALPFFSDLISSAVIGARTTESQTHRELASDSPVAFGFKNGTDGTPGAAIDAMKAAAHQHTLLGVDDNGQLEQRVSLGNDQTFVILRGGKSGPNFSPDHIKEVESALKKAGEPCRIVVDCSHGNSNKDYRKQTAVAASVAHQFAQGSPIAGVMLESNLEAGRQDIPPSNKGLDALKYGVSVTDGCIGWEETERVLQGLASAVQTRWHSQELAAVRTGNAQRRRQSSLQISKEKALAIVQVAEVELSD